MAKYLIVVPFSGGRPSFPTIPVNQIQGWVIGSYAPPPTGAPAYVLVWLDAAQAAIDTLAARADCLLICNIVNERFEATALTPTQRNAIRDKINAMGFTGAQFGLLNAAIQSSQNRSELAYAIATKAFYRSAAKAFMNNNDVNGTRIGG